MVSQRSWDTLQRPNSQNKNNQQPPIETDPIQTEDVKDNQANKSWTPLQTPETYQGAPDPTADEDSFGYLVRNVVSNAARVGESHLGRYGDTQSFLKAML